MNKEQQVIAITEYFAEYLPCAKLESITFDNGTVIAL